MPCWGRVGDFSRRFSRPPVQAITRVQESSQRYFDRPDATYVEVDPAAMDLGGWTGSINVNRQSGVHVVNANTFHLVRETHGFGKDSDRTNEKIQATPGVLQDMEEQAKV